MSGVGGVFGRLHLFVLTFTSVNKSAGVERCCPPVQLSLSRYTRDLHHVTTDAFHEIKDKINHTRVEKITKEMRRTYNSKSILDAKRIIVKMSIT